MSEEKAKTRNGKASQSAGGDAVYAIGIIGAAVFYWKRADSPGGRVVALLKALVWPAFLVYEALSALSERRTSAD